MLLKAVIWMCCSGHALRTLRVRGMSISALLLLVALFPFLLNANRNQALGLLAVPVLLALGLGYCCHEAPARRPYEQEPDRDRSHDADFAKCHARARDSNIGQIGPQVCGIARRAVVRPVPHSNRQCRAKDVAGLPPVAVEEFLVRAREGAAPRVVRKGAPVAQRVICYLEEGGRHRLLQRAVCLAGVKWRALRSDARVSTDACAQ